MEVLEKTLKFYIHKLEKEEKKENSNTKNLDNLELLSVKDEGELIDLIFQNRKKLMDIFQEITKGDLLKIFYGKQLNEKIELYSTAGYFVNYCENESISLSSSSDFTNPFEIPYTQIFDIDLIGKISCDIEKIKAYNACRILGIKPVFP